MLIIIYLLLTILFVLFASWGILKIFDQVKIEILTKQIDKIEFEKSTLIRSLEHEAKMYN